jgi:twinkle protein
MTVGIAHMLNKIALVRDEDIDFEKYLKTPPEAAKVKPASSYQQMVIDSFYGENPDPGCYLPWEKTHGHIKLRQGELSIWAGVNGHGKSMLLNQACLSLMAQSERVCIASLEMKPLATLRRMSRQFDGVEVPAIANIERFSNWTIDKLWLYDQIGTVKSERMYAVAQYCIKELGITHFVIDSLMKCGMRSDDYSAQKEFVDRLSTLAKDTNTHIHLVTHSRKGDKEDKVMDKFDIKGAGEITDMADNVFIVWKNKKKEAALNARNISPELKTKPDAMLIVDKQRNGEWEGKVSLWYHRPSFQLLPTPSCDEHGHEGWENCSWY